MCLCVRACVWRGQSHEGENNNKKQLAEAAAPSLINLFLEDNNETREREQQNEAMNKTKKENQR